MERFTLQYDQATSQQLEIQNNAPGTVCGYQEFWMEFLDGSFQKNLQISNVNMRHNAESRYY